MPNELRTEVEQVRQEPEVNQALKQTGTIQTESLPRAETKDKLLIGTQVIILLALAVEQCSMTSNRLRSVPPA